MAEPRLIFGLSTGLYADLAAVFARHPAIERVLIFGSRAKGTAQAASDIDLAVLAPTLSDGEFNTLWNTLDALPLVFKLDVLHWDRLDKPALKQKILDEGRLFYPCPDAACGQDGMQSR